MTTTLSLHRIGLSPSGQDASKACAAREKGILSVMDYRQIVLMIIGLTLALVIGITFFGDANELFYYGIS